MELIGFVVVGAAVGVSSFWKQKGDEILDSVDKRLGKYIEVPRREVFQRAEDVVARDMRLDQ